MILLNTRPIEYHAQFAADFARCDLAIVQSPVLRFENQAPWPGQAADYDALIFTSPAAPARRPADALWNSLPAYAVGPATAAAAHNVGFKHVRCTGATAADLAAVLDKEKFNRALHPGGEDLTLDLSLRFPGRVTRVATFRAVKNESLSLGAIKALRASTPTIAPLFSRRSAQAFADLLRAIGPHAAHVTALAISAAAIDVPNAPWNEALVSPAPNAAAMAALLNPHRRAA
jgi:uroporphyrinogen-III synthase